MNRMCITFVLIAAATAGLPPSGRIYGGKDAAPGQFPFIVALNDPDQFCDGSIVDKRWVVTAAHCIADITRSTTVLAGTHIEHSGGVSYHITKTIVHEDYDDYTGKNDIALIQIDSELEYSDLIQPIEFGEAGVNATCTAAGWGVTESVDFPDVVQFVELTSIDIDYCLEISERYLDGYYLGPEQVCTLEPEGKGVCFGDSGGPLICEGKLAGIVSYGVVAYCAYGYPDVYTRTTTYTDWVQQHIQEENVKNEKL